MLSFEVKPADFSCLFVSLVHVYDMFAYNLLQNVLELEEKNDVNPIIFAIDKRFTEFTMQKNGAFQPWKHFTSPPPNTATTTNMDDTHVNDNKIHRHENKHRQHRHLNKFEITLFYQFTLTYLFTSLCSF